jgi:hypothetical protein
VEARHVSPDAGTLTVRLFELVALGLWASGIVFVRRHRHPVYVGAYLGSSTLALFDWAFNTRWFFNVSYDDSFLALWRIDGEVQPIALCMTYAFYFGGPLLLAVHHRDRIDRALGRWAWPTIFAVSSLVNPLFEIPLVRWLHLWTYNQRPAFELAGVAWSNTWFSGLLFTTCYGASRVALRWSAIGRATTLALPAGITAHELRWRDVATGTAAIWVAFYASMQLQLAWYAVAQPWAASPRPF